MIVFLAPPIYKVGQVPFSLFGYPLDCNKQKSKRVCTPFRHLTGCRMQYFHLCDSHGGKGVDQGSQLGYSLKVPVVGNLPKLE
jgi:hypothetical protein